MSRNTESVVVESREEISGTLRASGLTWRDRIWDYHEKTGFPESLFIGGDGRCVGTWIMGNDYRVKSEYYGGYPAGYLRRVKTLFPDKTNVLHLFSGKVDKTIFDGKTVDLNAELNPDFVDDAQTLENVPLEQFDLVLADPPYSIEDAERYQTSMVKRNKVMQALGARLSEGAHVVWLDQVLPMFRKDQFGIEAVIGMVKSTNHRFRVITVFRKREQGSGVLTEQANTASPNPKASASLSPDAAQNKGRRLNEKENG